MAKLETKLDGGELRSRSREQQTTLAHRMQSTGGRERHCRSYDGGWICGHRCTTTRAAREASRRRSSDWHKAALARVSFSSCSCVE
jgi:hypothetical protein